MSSLDRFQVQAYVEESHCSCPDAPEQMKEDQQFR